MIGTNTGHGHVWKRPDGVVARCGGPAMCSVCAAELRAVKSSAPAAQIIAYAMLENAQQTLRDPAATPYARTVAEWTMRPREHPLDHYEDIHKRHGFVFSTPAYYVMGRPVRKFAPVEQILDVTHVFDFEACDAWFIFQLTGKVEQAWKCLPWELPWMCWVRQDDPAQELVFHETRRLMRLSGVGA